MSNFGLGVWAHNVTNFGDRDDVPRHADRLAEAGFDIVIPCVKNPPGAVDFVTDVADVNEAYPDWDPLRVLIDECGERGVKVHPWFCVFPEGDKSRLLRENPEYAAAFDNPMRFACACRPEVRDYLFALYKDLAERYQPAGLHLDYIRTGGQCRCEFCESEMAMQDVDITSVAPGDPGFVRWTQWRCDQVTGLVRRVHGLTREMGIELSAAVFAGYPWCLAGQGQDWVQWAEEGIVDYLFPMSYTPSLRVAGALATTHAALVGDKTALWEGFSKSSGESHIDTQTLAAEARLALQAGARGIVLFHYPAITDEDIAALKELSNGAER